MHSQTSLLLPLLALTATGLAQTTVQKIFFASPSNDDGYVGSVVNVAGDQTTYAVACTSGGASCYTGTSVTLTEGPTNFNAVTQTSAGGITEFVSATCDIAGTTSATCVAVGSESADGQSTAVTTTTTLGTANFCYHPITITAGASKLNNAVSTSASAAAPMITGMGVMGAVGLGVVALL